MACHLVVWHWWILALSLEIVRVLHRLLWSHGRVASHVASTVWQSTLRLHAAALHLSMRVVIGGIDLIVVVNAVLVAASGLGRVQACLRVVSDAS